MKKQQKGAAGCELTSTRWLSGPYRSLSSSITRLLKNEENFFFCLPGCETAKRQNKMNKKKMSFCGEISSIRCPEISAERVDRAADIYPPPPPPRLKRLCFLVPFHRGLDCRELHQDCFLLSFSLSLLLMLRRTGWFSRRGPAQHLDS